jgi:hypothetical protein
MAVWDDESIKQREAPSWSLTGQMLLWTDGSPAHVRQDPFVDKGNSWHSEARISRSTKDGNRWLKLIIEFDDDVRARWDAEDIDQRDRALMALATFMHLREWHGEDLGVLYLK